MKLSWIFSDGAVLQRGMVVPVWGEATPGVLVQGSVAGVQTFCRASSDGAFRLLFPELEAGGPYELQVSEVGSEACCVVHDVYVGEVWVASGQSNMEYALGSRWAAPVSESPSEAPVNVRQEADFSSRLSVRPCEGFHFLSLPKCAGMCPERSSSAVWGRMCDGYSEASAVASWFGLSLRDRLRVPVGLVISDWGGTIVEAWTSRGGLLSNPDTRESMSEYVRRQSDSGIWSESYEALRQRLTREALTPDGGNDGVLKGWAEADFSDDSWSSLVVPGAWTSQGLAGNGAVWIRREIQVPASYAGHDLQLDLGGIDKHDITYFNGVEVGRTGKDLETEHWNVSRHYAIPGKLVRGGRNVIAIRGYSFIYDGGFNGAPEQYMLRSTDGSLRLPLAGEWKAGVEKDLGVVTLPVLDRGLFMPDNPNTPSILFDGMIRPLLGYAMRGVIWYQGESNARTLAESASYGRKLATMIQDWRHHWEQPEFPFIQVELANFRCPLALEPGSTWSVLREQQRAVTHQERNVFMATAIDCGEAQDIHPQDKRTVGSRLAKVALKEVYGSSEEVASGPVLRSWLPGQDGSVQLTFDHGDGMTLTSPAGTSFFLAGDDRRFYPAELYDIHGHTLILATSKVPVPVAIRYGWADNPSSILYNGEGWPASPFRTDDWSADSVSLGR